MKIVLACDESGAKGYADRDESFDGEVGLFAGIMVPESHLTVVEADLQSVVQAYKSVENKLHIADLAPPQQAALRAEIYAVIRKHSLPCFWYAIHVAGFHAWHTTQQEAVKRAKAIAAAASSQPGRFKGGSPREEPESLHVALFDGLYAHLVAFLEERDCKEVDIEVRTDRVDNPIVKNFEEVATRLLGDMTYTKMSKRFDTVTKALVEGQIRISAHLPESLQLGLRVRSLQINAVEDDTDGLVLAADVLANSLVYLFTQRGSAERYRRLNWPSAVKDHPLAGHLDAFNNWGDGDVVGDVLYRHPKAPAE
ncbi:MULTISPECIES: hypothetical protein [unclassified Devosia]|jgi:hypothetical protein|uniref:hypothetical protein n=1 Tax=unclassified Devosia TaxID=196773 RepID=UPI00086BD107|nr:MULTISPECIES: hypothetical protein [unclassified Devosia]MBN9361779.1 hypothetical protein [Devosia sp.]ODS87604.1 MAG: hypothetical protein ABS47_11745 [Devosia sp. SCN 66-27]OJX26805.1 MAG: hypothetical protein BGO83_23470 [Devosia sp. 66-14]